ncbi:acyltransferase domain-containing protein [Nocardiopsis flavescens]|uniref:acyltransferase domain-containing protein n=1 Tax=Nocardiopsis flavescens TaxID=758803 RepID=UPI003656D21F
MDARTDGTAEGPAAGTAREDPGATDRWLEALCAQEAGAARPDPVPPTASRARERLRWLAVPDADAAEALSAAPDPRRTPGLWQALLRCHRALFSGAPVAWPDAPAELGAAGRYFYLHLYLLALPAALEAQAARGVPADVVRATFADVGAKTASYRNVHGAGGFDRQAWAVRHYRGLLYRLGRLQFERAALDAAACGGAPHGGGPADGETVLDVHIPGGGPMTPAACDASFAAAPGFFGRYFPGTAYRHATCHSWLLDGRLADHLPADSNIVRFQARFRLFGRWPVSDDDVLRFVFEVDPATADRDRLPAVTGVQRAVLGHLRSGGHWRTAHGWAPLPDPS